MKQKLTLLFPLFIALSSYGQDRKTIAAIEKEGKALYRSEMASWYGTDIFLEKFKGLRDSAGGYFSYSDNAITKCIFFSREEAPRVLVMFSFDSSYNVNTAGIDSRPREFSPMEKDIYQVRQSAVQAINSDTLFKGYENTRLNIIPLVNGNEKKVYVLTGPQVNGVVIFGNDYLLTFDENNNLTAKKQLHRNIIPMNYGQEGQEAIRAMHSHQPETGDYITPTDICTLMLYSKFAKWNQHYVMSENYVSIWDCEKNELLVLTRKAWDRIYDDQKKKGNN